MITERRGVRDSHEIGVAYGRQPPRAQGVPCLEACLMGYLATKEVLVVGGAAE